MKKILVAVPTRGVVFTETLNALKFIGEWSGNLDVEFIGPRFTEISPVSKARNEIAHDFLTSGCDLLWMVDDDEVPPVNALKNLLELNADIAVIDCPSKGNGKSNIFKNKDGEIVASGFGCALFKKEVFTALSMVTNEPFSLLPRRIVNKRGGLYTFEEVEGEENAWGGEDINFSLKVRDLGFEIKQAEGVCTHLEYEPFNSERRAIELLKINRYDEIKGEAL